MSGAGLAGTCLCGAAGWAMTQAPDRATSCNCTSCRRRAGLWAYGHEDETITVHGALSSYVRGDEPEPYLATSFCPVCGIVVAWRGLAPEPDGRRRMAVNLRLVDDPARVAALPLRRFDGLDSFTDLPDDGRCVRDLWC